MKTEAKNSFLDEYKNKFETYKDFSDRLKTIIKDILDINGLSYLYIEGRAKAYNSLEHKLDNFEFKKLEEVQDLCGIRIITYVYRDIKAIEEVISKHFKCSQLIVDERLGTDKVGYRSHHWLITLPEDRLKLPEYERFGEMRAELQIRTVLQHAWAQIGHKQVYKPSAILPEKIMRDFTLLSGLLEVADNEFERISTEILGHENKIIEKRKSGNLEIPIDTISLRQYFDEYYKNLDNLEPQFGPKDDMAEEIISEFKDMGITTLADINSITPKDLIDKIKKYRNNTNYCGIARNIMIIHNADLYFKQAWKKNGVGLWVRKYIRPTE